MKSTTFYDHETRKEHHISDKMAADDELNNEVLNLLEAPYKKEVSVVHGEAKIVPCV